MKVEKKETLEIVAVAIGMLSLLALLLLAQANRKPHDCNQRGCCTNHKNK